MPFVIAAALMQQEGGGNPMKTVGFLFLCACLGTAGYCFLFAEKKQVLGIFAIAGALATLWGMAGLPYLPIHKVIFQGDGAFIMPLFTIVHTRQQARQTLVAAAGMCILCAYMGAWLYIPTIVLALAVSFWPQAKQLPASAINFVRRPR